jgi:hypothetical protein
MPRSRRQLGSSAPQRLVLLALHSPHAPARAPVLRQKGRSGSGQLGEPSAVQPTQVWVVVEQSGVTPPQSDRVRQPAQTPTPEEVSHFGMAAGQCEVSATVQAAQAPLARQIGAAASQSALPAQARQLCAAVSQTGVVPPHWAFDTQATQVPEDALQTGVVPLQRVALVSEQTPQAPVGWQAGSAPPQSLSPAQPRQMCADGSQTGADALVQSVLLKQPTQLPALVSQSGVVPPQALAFVPEHWPQAPDGSQAGVEPPHSPSPAQARHAWVVVLQMGAVPLHWALATQPTHAPADTSHTEVEPPQADALVAEHCPQAPDDWQAGVAPPHSPSAEQPRQIRLVPSHTGVAPEH